MGKNKNQKRSKALITYVPGFCFIGALITTEYSLHTRNRPQNQKFLQ